MLKDEDLDPVEDEPEYDQDRDILDPAPLDHFPETSVISALHDTPD